MRSAAAAGRCGIDVNFGEVREWQVVCGGADFVGGLPVVACGLGDDLRRVVHPVRTGSQEGSGSFGGTCLSAQCGLLVAPLGFNPRQPCTC